MTPARIAPEDLRQLFRLKYGDPATTGWSPRRRFEFGYYQPADYYEALVEKLVTAETDWIDIGGGGALFPDNHPLSKLLSERARRLVAVDPSDNLDSNPYPQERAKCMIEEYQTSAQFDLATFRMVAEHITNPASVVNTLNRLLRPHGLVVIFTVNRFSPVTMVSSLYHFRSHAGELIERMRKSARKAVIISEPVQNWSSKPSLLGKAAMWLSNPGVGEYTQRFDREGFEALAKQHGASEFFYSASDRNAVAIFQP